MLRFPIEPAAIRVFRGYRRPLLPEQDFLKEIGEVFMPGTPFMLRELGLAAYLPALVPPGAEPELPDEVAIICYASAEAYQRARNESLTGRLYTHTHRGVFDMDRSRSLPAQPLTGFTSPVTAFALAKRPVDWQVDGTVVVFVGERADPADPTFGSSACSALAGISPQLDNLGIRECVGEVAEAWLACWFLLDGFVDDPRAAIQPVIAALGARVKEVALMSAERLVWRDAPPTAPAIRGGAWSYIFERSARHFLR